MAPSRVPRQTSPAATPPELVQTSSLRPHPKNPRRGHVEAVTDSIRMHGFYGALVVQRSTNYILVGETRWRAAVGLGITQVPATILDVDDTTAERILASDNKLSDDAEYDMAALDALLADLAATAEGLDGTGYEEADVETPPRVEQHAVQAPPAMTWVLLGLPTVRYGEIAERVQTLVDSTPDLISAVSVSNA